jgi:hypothetical protein
VLALSVEDRDLQTLLGPRQQRTAAATAAATMKFVSQYTAF